MVAGLFVGALFFVTHPYASQPTRTDARAECGLVIVNRDGDVVAWSAEAEDVTGWSKERMVGRRLDEILVDRDVWRDTFLRSLKYRYGSRYLRGDTIARDGKRARVDLSLRDLDVDNRFWGTVTAR